VGYGFGCHIEVTDKLQDAIGVYATLVDGKRFVQKRGVKRKISEAIEGIKTFEAARTNAKPG